MIVDKAIEKIEMKLQPSRRDIRWLIAQLKTSMADNQELQRYIMHKHKKIIELEKRVKFFEKNSLRIAKDAE